MTLTLLAVFLLLPPASAPAAPPKDFSAAKSPAEIYSAYREARKLAPQILKAIKADQELYDALNTADNRASKEGMRGLIEASTVSTAPAIRARLANIDDFTIDSYEGGLVCGTATRRWLDRIEAKGPSEESWKLRAEYLEGYAGVDMPWCEGLCEGPGFDMLVGALTEAKGIYPGKAYRARLSGWVRTAAARFEADLRKREREVKASKDEEAAKAFPEQAKEVRGWIDLLRGFAEPPAGKKG